VDWVGIDLVGQQQGRAFFVIERQPYRAALGRIATTSAKSAIARRRHEGPIGGWPECARALRELQ
jgi:hypothetical protein